jgi:hypothetical protein
MKLTQEEKNEVRKMVDTMIENLESIKYLFKANMEESEYERFSRKTLAALEPGLTPNHCWVVNHINPLDTVVDDIEVNEDEPRECCECGDQLDEWGACFNDKCPTNKPI